MAQTTDLDIIRKILLPILAAGETIGTSIASKGSYVGSSMLGQMDRLDALEKERQAAIERAAQHKQQGELIDIQKKLANVKLAEAERKTGTDQTIRDMLGGAYVEGTQKLNPAQQTALAADPQGLLKTMLPRPESSLDLIMKNILMQSRQSDLAEKQKTPEQKAQEQAETAVTKKKAIAPVELDTFKKKEDIKLANMRKKKAMAFEEHGKQLESVINGMLALEKQVPAQDTGLMARGKGLITKGKAAAGYAPIAKQLETMGASFLPTFAKSIGKDVGNLAQQEQERWRGMLFKFTDTKEERDLKRAFWKGVKNVATDAESLENAYDTVIQQINQPSTTGSGPWQRFQK